MKLRAIAALALLAPALVVAQTKTGTQPIIGTTGAAQVKATGSTTARQLQDWFADEINVKAYGAKGDGSTDDAASINAAFNACSSSGCRVKFTAGTFIVGNTVTIPEGRPVDIVGSGINTTTIKLKNSAAVDVVSHASFATLTGTSSTGGVFRVAIHNLTIDGNKANNSAGYGLRLYGKGFNLENVSIQNAKNDGLWTEYGGADDFSTPSGKLESTFVNLQTQLNGGVGWKHKGPHDSFVLGFVSYGNGTWGWDIGSPVHGANVNTYLNTTGGIWIHGSGSLTGSDIAGTTGTGTGVLVDSGTGGSIFDGTFTGPIAIEVKSPNHRISGLIANSSTAGLKLNGGSVIGDFLMFSNSGYWFDVSAQNGGSNIRAYGVDGTGTLFNGTPQGAWQMSGAKTYTHFPTASLDSSNGWTPVLPPSNATLAVFGGAGPTYGATVSIAAQLGNLFVITATNSSAFTISNPTNPVATGQVITDCIRNQSGGVLGAATFDTGYKLGASWTQPASTKTRCITFAYDGAGSWIEINRSSADVSY